MFLIIGLGNPGKQYKSTWHNLGFLAVDGFKSQMANFSDWKNMDRAQSLISEGEINNKKIILAKPQTFMNNSGRSVQILVAYYKTPATNMIVLHDDADLPIGAIRISKNSGSAGHRGIESIIGHLKTKNFIRIRFGSRPKNYIPGSKSLKRSVLKIITKADKKNAEQNIQKITSALEIILEGKPEKAMSLFNG